MARAVMTVIYIILLIWGLALLAGAATLVVFICEELRGILREVRGRRRAAQARSEVVYRNMALRSEREILRSNKEREAADSRAIDPWFDEEMGTLINGS